MRAVDVGIATFADGATRAFTLRVSAGLEATMVEEAPREEKERSANSPTCSDAAATARAAVRYA